MHRFFPLELRAVLVLVVSLAAVPPGVGAQDGAPAGPVPVDLLEARRDALLERLDGTPAVFGASVLRSIEGDYPQDSDFRQDNDFFYLTGLESRDAWLVLNVPEPGEVVLYLPRRNPGEERWTGPLPGPGPEASARSGITAVRPLESLPADLRGRLGDRPWISPGHPANRPVLEPLLGDAATSVRSPAPLMAELRLVKDAEEIRRLRRAVEITAAAMREAWRVVEPGMDE